MKGKNRYAAWARKSGSSDEYVTTIVYAKNIAEAREKFKPFELDSKIYLSKVKT